MTNYRLLLETVEEKKGLLEMQPIIEGPKNATIVLATGIKTFDSYEMTSTKASFCFEPSNTGGLLFS